MSEASKRKTRKKVQSYRERLRAAGLRPIQVWVPDTRTARFRREAHRQSLAIAQSPGEEEDQAWVDAVSEFNEA